MQYVFTKQYINIVIHQYYPSIIQYFYVENEIWKKFENCLKDLYEVHERMLM